MKQGKVAIVALMMTIILCLSPLGAAAATAKTVKVTTQSVTLVFDGQELKLPEKQYSFIYDGRVYVPVRYISYALLKKVGWDGKQVTVSEPTDAEREKLRANLQQASAGAVKPQASVKLDVKPQQAKLLFDGKEKKLPEGQDIYNFNGSIYVPVRFLAESVGTAIGWDPKSKTVSGESEAYKAEQGNGGVNPGAGNGSTGGEAGSGTGGTVPPATGGGGAVPGAGGGVVTKPTYEQITAEAEASLSSLRQACFIQLTSTYLDYKDAADASVKESLKARGQSELDACTAKFEVIMTATSAKLTSNGYSTDIIAEYRKSFQKTIDDAKKSLS